MFIFPILTPVFGIMAFYFWRKEYGKAEIKMSEKRDDIEKDLPRFVSTVAQELKSGCDILAIMENFKKSANAKFAKELNIACADMRSASISSYEIALTRFEARIGSPMLSEAVRGLISAARGDDSSVYFNMLSHDFKLVELQKLKKQAQKIPGKIRIYSLLMLGVFLMMYFVVMGMQILDSVSSMGI
jgi:pilus assembly protein TadC